MNVETLHTLVDTHAGELFAYLAEAANMPEWATEFIHEARPDGEGILARTRAGELRMSTRANAPTGVVDIVAAAGDGPAAVFPTRVVPVAENRCLFSFTLVQAPDQPDDAFAEELDSLRRELDNLRRRFAA